MAGDHEAFSDLARASIARLHALARLVLRDGAQADDATQEALVAAWRQLPSLRDPDRFEPWLHRLLVRACYREASRHRRRRTIEARVTPLETMAPDPGLLIADQDQLGRGFDRLSPEQRALVVLRIHLEVPVRDTAEILGLPEGTVKSRLNRTIQELRALLEADDRPPVTATRLA